MKQFLPRPDVRRCRGRHRSARLPGSRSRAGSPRPSSRSTGGRRGTARTPARRSPPPGPPRGGERPGPALRGDPPARTSRRQDARASTPRRASSPAATRPGRRRAGRLETPRARRRSPRNAPRTPAGSSPSTGGPRGVEAAFRKNRRAVERRSRRGIRPRRASRARSAAGCRRTPTPRRRESRARTVGWSGSDLPEASAPPTAPMRRNRSASGPKSPTPKRPGRDVGWRRIPARRRESALSRFARSIRSLRIPGGDRSATSRPVIPETQRRICSCPRPLAAQILRRCAPQDDRLPIASDQVLGGSSSHAALEPAVGQSRDPLLRRREGSSSRGTRSSSGRTENCREIREALWIIFSIQPSGRFSSFLLEEERENLALDRVVERGGRLVVGQLVGGRADREAGLLVGSLVPPAVEDARGSACRSSPPSSPRCRTPPAAGSGCSARRRTRDERAGERHVVVGQRARRGLRTPGAAQNRATSLEILLAAGRRGGAPCRRRRAARARGRGCARAAPGRGRSGPAACTS